MRVVLISTYELGRQPFGLASPAAWLRSHAHQVTCTDLAIDQLPESSISNAGLIAFHLPMHTATRMAVKAIARTKVLNPRAHLCCYGLYAPLNEPFLRELGVHSVLGGEFEAALLRLADNLASGTTSDLPIISQERLQFLVPDRSSLPVLGQYASLRVNGAAKVAGYTEASRGCKHLCRHCPIVPVYNGNFHVVQRGIVLEDVRMQVRAGAGHITFGDPDFWNGPTHAMRIVEQMHAEFPDVTWDATIKVEHLRAHRELLPRLKETGCLFITTAVESFQDHVLALLAKGHTRAEFIAAVEDFHRLGLTLAPTFIPFTPWTTIESYREFLRTLLELDLVENISPVQLALRLLIPGGSRLLELKDIQNVLQGYDAPALLHRWRHADAAVDALAAKALKIAAGPESRHEIFRAMWSLASNEPLHENFDLMPRATIPYMDEPWYC